MTSVLYKAEAFDWVLGKVSAAKATPVAPKAPVYVQPAPLDQTKPVRDMKVVRAKEMELFKKWKYGGKKPEDFQALYGSHKNLVQKRINVFKGAEVPRAAVEFEHIKWYRKALESFDETKGAALHSWITTNLKKPRRLVITTQNFARITEPLANKIGKFNSARSELTARLGHEPSTDDVVEHTGFSKKDVMQLNRQLRKSLMMTGTGDEAETGSFHTTESERLIADLIYPKLRSHEKVVHEYLFPRDGRKAITSTTALAKKLGWHPSKVSKAKTAIVEHINTHLPD